jgi:copper chaperone CopZ
MMRQRAIALLGIGLLGTTIAVATAATPARVNVRLGGVVCEECAKSLRAALGKVPGIRFTATEIRPGEEPKHFTDPILIEIADTDKTDLGALAKAVAEARTPHQDKHPPSLNLTLFGVVDEPAVSALRTALVNVPGVDANGPGGIGGILQDDTFWVRLHGSGEATLAEIRRALEAGGIRHPLERP